MNNWSNQEILQLLECYQAEPCIWDPRDRDHKNKKKVADAWNRISEVLKKPVKEIKNKKEILMVIFRKYLKKKQESIRSSSGAGDIYEPVWFAYHFMESFLLPVYTSKIGLNSETQSITSETVVEEMVDEIEETENDDLVSPSTSADKASTKKSRRRPATNTAEEQMATAFCQLTTVLSQRQSGPSGEEEDECDLYAKLLAKKLRELPKDDRKIIMYEIDGLFIKRINHRLLPHETPSPQYLVQYSRPSSAATDYTTNRQSNAHISHSEPITYMPNQPPHVETSHSDLFTNIIVSPNRPSVQNYYAGRTSTPLPPPPRNTNDNFISYTTQPSSSNPASNINIISDEIIVPPRQDIIHAALLKAYEDFEAHQ